MRNYIIASAGLVAALASVPAVAADAVMIDPPVDVIIAQAFNWTGGYVGIQAGYLWGDGHYSVVDGTYADPNPDGFLGGFYAGYNYQMSNNVVLGIDADFAWTNADDFGTGYTPGGAPIGGGVGINQEINWTGAVRGRLGYAVDRFLPYIAGGVAFADVDSQAMTGGVTVASYSDTMVGWTIGAGVEYAFTDNLVGRAEYRYTDFGNESLGASGRFPGGRMDLTTNDVRIGLAYKF